MRERPPRTFEDLAVGEVRESRRLTVSQSDMINFARQYDPQWFHTDPDAAKESTFGELVASGIYNMALVRLLDHEINGDIDYVCGVGWDDLRLKVAVKANDTVFVRSQILELKPSTSGAKRGTAITRYALINQRGDEAVYFTSINLVYTRAARQKPKDCRPQK